MEQSKPEVPRDPIPKSENDRSSDRPAIPPGETNSGFTKPEGSKFVDLTQSDGEDSTYIDSTETKQQSLHGNVSDNPSVNPQIPECEFS